MRRRALLRALVICVFCGWGCSRPPAGDEREMEDPVEIDLPAFGGKSVGEVAESLSLRFDKYFVIDEPPGLGRGVVGKTPDGREVWLYISLGNAIERPKEYWKLEQFLVLPVAGMAYQSKGRWHTAGEVIRHFHWNPNRR